MKRDLVGQWILEAAVIRDGELDPNEQPHWNRESTIDGPAIPRAIVEVSDDGRFVQRDEEPFKNESLRVFDQTGVLMPFGQGAGNVEAFWRPADDGTVDAYVVTDPDSKSNRRRDDYPAITDTLQSSGASLTRRVLAVTDGIYLNEHVLTYARYIVDASDGNDALSWLGQRCNELGAAMKPEDLPSLLKAHPKLGTECANRFIDDESEEAASALLSLRAEVDRVMNLRGHKKKADTYVWAARCAEQLDQLLAAKGRVFVSPKLKRAKFDQGHASLLLAHGHHDAVAEWADATLKKNSKTTRQAALIMRVCADIVKGEYAPSVERIAALEAADRTSRLLWLLAVAQGLGGDIEAAVRTRVSFIEDENARPVLSFRHVLGLSKELLAAFQLRAEEVLSSHERPLLFGTPKEIQRYTRLSFDMHGKRRLLVARDETGNYVPVAPGQDPEGSIPWPADGPDPAEHVFDGAAIPERMLLLALRLQLAHHRREFRNNESVQLLRGLIEARAPELLAT